MSESQKPLQILDIFNTQNFITNKDYVTYKAQGIVTVPNGLKFGDGSYLNGDLYSVNGTLVLDLGTDGTDATFNGDVNGDLYGDIYNSSSTKVFDTDTQTFSGNLQIHQAFDANYVSGSIKFSTSNAADTWDVAEIESYIGAGPGNSTGGYPGGLAFKTNDVVGGSPENDVTTKMVINAAGNVGIGTTDPEEKIHVIGNAKVDGDLHVLGNYLPDSNNNFKFGTDALVNATSGYNIGLGFESLKLLTSGIGSNTAIGYRAGYNHVGYNNLFIGTNAGYDTSNTSAQYNFFNSTAIGYNAQITASNQLTLGSSSTRTLVGGTLECNNIIFDINDEDTGIEYNSNTPDSFNLKAGNNDIFSVSQNQTTTNGTMKIVETIGTYGSDTAGSLELIHATGQSSSIIFQGSGNDYGFIRYIDDWKNVSDLSSYSDLLLGPDRTGWGPEKSTLFIGTQNNATQGGDDSIVIRPSASLVLDTGSSSSEVSNNAGNIYMKPNGGSVVIGQPDIEGVTENPRVAYQGVPLTVVALDSNTATQSDIFEVLKLERKLNDLGNASDTNNDGGGYIGMHVNDYNSTAELARIAWRSTNSNVTEKSGKIEFYTANNSVTPTKRMTINYNGNVGIGTETPTSLLDVAGDTTLNGQLNANTVVLNNPYFDTTITNEVNYPTSANAYQNFSQHLLLKATDKSYRNYYIGLLGESSGGTNVLAFGYWGGNPEYPKIITTFDTVGDINTKGNFKGAGANLTGAVSAASVTVTGNGSITAGSVSAGQITATTQLFVGYGVSLNASFTTSSLSFGNAGTTLCSITSDGLKLNTTSNTATSGAYSGNNFNLAFDCNNLTYKNFTCSVTGVGVVNRYQISNVRESGLYKVRVVNGNTSGNIIFDIVSNVGTFKFSSTTSLTVVPNQHAVLTFFHIDSTTYVTFEAF